MLCIYLVYTKHNRTNIVINHRKTLKLFLAITYKSMTKNPKTLSETEKSTSEGKRQFQYVLIR